MTHFKQHLVCASGCKDVIGEYKLGARVGTGGYGIVMEATKISTGEKFAVKEILAAKIDEVKLEREIRIQQLLHHKHVVRIVDVLRKNGNTYIVMELALAGNLLEFIERNVHLPEKRARHLFQQIIAGVEHCHLNKIAHRDLKPENIFLDDALNIKIGDFGLSAKMEEGRLLTSSCGTANYLAPELLTRNCKYDGPEVDIWSCGIILFNLLCSECPFHADKESDLFESIRKGQFVVPRYVSSGAKDLIKKMLTVRRSERISLSHIKEHPWFTEDLPTDLFPRCVGAQYAELEKDVDEPSLQKVVEPRSTSSDMAASRSTSTQSSLFNHNQHEKKVFDSRSKTIESNASPTTSTQSSLFDHHEKEQFLETRSTTINTNASPTTSTQSSLFDHHEKEQFLETGGTLIDMVMSRHLQKQDAYFDGVWVADGDKIASISATSLVWADGSDRVTISNDTHGKKIFMKWQGNEYMAELGDDGRLHWSDGDTWERQVKPSLARSMRELLNATK